jgi:hypothetical protein
MKTRYTVILTNGQSDSKTSRVADYVAGIQAVNWQGNLRLVGLSRTMGYAAKSAARMTANGLKNVQVLDVSRA